MLSNIPKSTIKHPFFAMRLLSAWSVTDDREVRRGLVRSLFVYYGIPGRRRRLARFYAQFMQRGDLAFDIGAHVGNRIQAWRNIGTRVVGVEPQPACMSLLQRWYGADPDVVLVDAAVGATVGEATLHISPRTPTVTTLSQEWQHEVQQVASFANVTWEEKLSVKVTTVAQLTARFGLPAFCKIDVEGYELEVLKGISQPIPSLSIEYIPATKETTQACIAELERFGDYRFNWSTGESHRLQSERWLQANEIVDVIMSMNVNDDSGDLYARLHT